MATYPVIKPAQLPHYLSLIRPLITSSNIKPEININSKTITKVISPTAPFAEFCKLNNENIYRVALNLRVIWFEALLATNPVSSGAALASETKRL